MTSKRAGCVDAERSASDQDKAGTWFRVSTKDQDEQSQVPEVMKWVSDHSYIHAATYTIPGSSAFHGNRKFDVKWAEVLDDFRSGKINVLVVWKQNRLDRKLEATKMIKDVVDLGGRIEFTSQPHLNDLSTMGGRIALKVEEEIAHAESKGKSDNLKIKIAALFAAGSISGKHCFGFTIATRGSVKTLVPESSEADAIRQAVERYLSGDSLLKICRWLDSQSVKPRHASAWEPKSLSNIFRNQSLIGRRKNEDGKTVLRHDPILARETWDKLQSEMDRRANRKGIIGREDTAKLTNIAVCADCGGPMYLLKNVRPKKVYLYYRCHGRESAPSKCRNMVPAGWLDEAVESLMRHPSHRLFAVPMIETIVIPGHGHDDEIADVERDIRDLDMDANDYMGQVATLRAERERLKSLPAEANRVITRETGITLGEYWWTLDDAAKRGFLLELGITVSAGKDGAALHCGFASSVPRIAEALQAAVAAS